MAAKFDVEVTISSAKDLKNVNWRHGHLKPYAVVWTDQTNQLSSKVASESDNSYVWDQKIVVPLLGRLDDDVILSIDVVQADPEEDTKPLIGAARLKLHEVVDKVGFGERLSRTLQLKRPSGRPQGKIDVKVIVRENHYVAPPQYPPSYGVPVHGGSRDYYAQPPASYGQPYGGPPATAPYGQHYGAPAPVPNHYPVQPPTGYPGGGYNAPPTQYGQPAYEQGTGRGYAAAEEKKKNKFCGMGAGIALGALGGILGGIALHEGLENMEERAAERAAEKVEASHHRRYYEDQLNYDDY